MHEAEGVRLGLKYRYRLIDFDQLHLDDSALDPVLRLSTQLGLAGLNITHPFKERVVEALDELSPEVSEIGAANTVVMRGATRVGHNTDSWGFSESFRQSMTGARLDRVVLLGAGGAGMAVAHALLELGVGHLSVFDIKPEKSAALARRFTEGSGRGRIAAVDDLERALFDASGVVNATPVGMAKYPGMPLPANFLNPSIWVADIVYVPEETALLRAAKRAGCRTLSGAGMAIFQAIRAFELITGQRSDPDHMARHFAAS